MTAEFFEQQRKDMEEARDIGLDAGLVLNELSISGGPYRSYVWDTQWLTGKIDWEQLKAAFLISLGPLPGSLSHFTHQGVALRLRQTREFTAAGLPFMHEFAAEVDDILFRNMHPMTKLMHLLEQIHEATTEDIDYFLNTIADLLQNQLVLRSGNTLYRIAELEFYYWQRAHRDMYIHKDAAQRRMGRWYFNEADCLDLTFGSQKLNYYGGILLRGLQRLTATTTAAEISHYVCGPRNVLKELIAQLGDAFSSRARGLGLEKAPTNAFEPIKPWQVRRYGLRQKPEDEDAEFLNRRYRYLVDNNYLRELRDRADVVRQLSLPKEEAKAILGYYPTTI